MTDFQVRILLSVRVSTVISPTFQIVHFVGAENHMVADTFSDWSQSIMLSSALIELMTNEYVLHSARLFIYHSYFQSSFNILFALQVILSPFFPVSFSV